MDFSGSTHIPNPREKANPFSKLFFLWILPMFKKGFRNTLELKDLYNPLSEDLTEPLGDQLQRIWEKELAASKVKVRKKPSLLKALVKLFWKPFTISFIFLAIDSWIISIGQFMFLRLLLSSLRHENSQDSGVTTQRYLYAGGISICALFHQILFHNAMFGIYHLGMQCRAACSSLIYRKMLKISQQTLGQTTLGLIVNLLSNDVNKFDTNMDYIPFAVIGPIQALIFAYFLYNQLGMSSFTGIGLVFFLVPFQFFIGSFSARFRRNIAIKTDERGRIMNEIIIGMRIIKFYAWEQPFSTIIDGIRRMEVGEIRRRGVLRGIVQAFVNFAPKLVSFATFSTYVVSGHKMSGENVFFAVAAFDVVIMMMARTVPMVIAGLGELKVSLERVQEFLLSHEKEEVSRGKPVASPLIDEQASVQMNNLSAGWCNSKVCLNNLNVDITGAKLILVVGPIGSGKSSLLNVITKELLVKSGTLNINGRVSYAAQEPWVFAGTVKQNILFGLAYDEDKYEEVVDVCALSSDFAQLPKGDATVVGERGVSLSGGQKARVNLARAIYRDADIFILDDPLSAVDPKVSRHLFDYCVKRYLNEKLRILVTHQLQYAAQADHIIIMNEGSIIFQGTYEESTSLDIDFMTTSTALAKPTSESFNRKKSMRMSISENLIIDNEQNVIIEDDEVTDEKMGTGSVSFSTYWEYFSWARAPFILLIVFTSFLSAQVFISGHDYWLYHWTKAEKEGLISNQTWSFGQGLFKTGKLELISELDYLSLYALLVIGTILFCLASCALFLVACSWISINLHDEMFSSIVRAPVAFFDENPSGRIMNRFTKDCGVLDELLGIAMSDTIVAILRVIGVSLIVIISNYILCIPAVFLFTGLIVMRTVFIRSSRDLKRIEAITKSPLFSHVAATMQGLTTIRALGCEAILRKQFDSYQDLHSSAWYLFMAGNRWFGLWLELISCVFLTCVSFSFLFISNQKGSEAVGLAISSVMSLAISLQLGLRQSAETENYMTSAERALEYAKIEPEAALQSTPDKKPPRDWPKFGTIEFSSVSLCFKNKVALNNISFKVKGKEKIGIVGRTGAGKSTIITALFRMTEPAGEIFIDGVKINDIGLHDLRKQIALIPQDPVLFYGTVRYNLDPFGTFTDHMIWRVIEEVKLKTAVSSLDDEVAESGSNFSVGQRQLFCLARAILRKNKIIVMDEATANVDHKTDYLIQHTMREKFKDCTILIVAHRLQTVIDCDRILVMDKGQLVEFSHPHVLLQNSQGYLAKMVKYTGREASESLRKMAADTYKGRRMSFSCFNIEEVKD